MGPGGVCTAPPRQGTHDTGGGRAGPQNPGALLGDAERRRTMAAGRGRDRRGGDVTDAPDRSAFARDHRGRQREPVAPARTLVYPRRSCRLRVAERMGGAAYRGCWAGTPIAPRRVPKPE